MKYEVSSLYIVYHIRYSFLMKSTLLGEEEEKEGANGERVVGCE